MRKLALPIAMALLVMAGCEGTRTAQPPPVSEPAVSDPAPVITPKVAPETVRIDSSSDSLLKYFAYVRKLQAAELAKEHDTARQLYSASRTDFNRVRYAMLLSIPGAAFSDDARALETLDPLLKNQTSALYGVAFMLTATIQEQRRSQGLQHKLEALRSLEKDLLDRDGGKRK